MDNCGQVHSPTPCGAEIFLIPCASLDSLRELLDLIEGLVILLDLVVDSSFGVHHRCVISAAEGLPQLGQR